MLKELFFLLIILSLVTKIFILYLHFLFLLFLINLYIYQLFIINAICIYYIKDLQMSQTDIRTDRPTNRDASHLKRPKNT